MNIDNDLDSFLNGPEPADADAEPAVVEAPAPAQTEAAPAATTRDEQGRFVPKGDEAGQAPQNGASPAPEQAPEPALDHPALLGERRRRQAVEAELERLRAQAQQPAATQQPARTDGPPDRYEDPEGYDAWLIQSVTTEARSAAVAAAQEERIMLAADAAREKYGAEDWAEKASAFADLARQNPALEAQLRQARDPADFAYKTAKRHLDLAAHGGDLDALIAARVAEAVAKAQPVAAQPTPETVAIPQSLAGSQSARSSAAPAGPPTLDDILK